MFVCVSNFIIYYVFRSILQMADDFSLPCSNKYKCVFVYYRLLKNNIPTNWLNENSQFLPSILSLTDGIMGAYPEQGEHTVICFKHLL